MYSARNVPPDKLMPMLIEFDRRVDTALAALIGLESEASRAELKRIRALPRVSRGFGVRLTAPTSGWWPSRPFSPAHASFASSSPRRWARSWSVGHELPALSPFVCSKG